MGQRSHKPGEFGGRERIGKATGGLARLANSKFVEFGQSFIEKSNRRAGTTHLHFQVGVGDLDAGSQQNAIPPALRCDLPHRFEDLVRLPEEAGVVEREAVANGGMIGGNDGIKTKRDRCLDDCASGA